MSIPFVWTLQTVLDHKDWCTCKRCKKALNNLRKHVGARR